MYQYILHIHNCICIVIVYIIYCVFFILYIIYIEKSVSPLYPVSLLSHYLSLQKLLLLIDSGFVISGLLTHFYIYSLCEETHRLHGFVFVFLYKWGYAVCFLVACFSATQQ